MYIDKYLKFPTKPFADAVLYTLHPKQVDEDNKVIRQEYYTPNYQNIDTIGILYQQEGEELVPMEGWHVNVRVLEGIEDATILEDFEVTPRHPRRIWG